jgi:hypothetical protein
MIPLLVPIGLGLIGGYLSQDSTQKFSGGGGVDYVDLFEYYELQPKKLSKITDKWSEKYMEGDVDYDDTKKYLKEVEAVGYTFDFGLDNEPYGLRPKGVKLSQLKGYEKEADEYAKGGGINDWTIAHEIMKGKKYYFLYNQKSGKRIGLFTTAEEAKKNLSKYTTGGRVKRARYNKGAAWTLDHYQHNKSENYEVPKGTRKHKRKPTRKS